MITAKISEIFKSTQGEGLYVGIEQLFVRFFGCNIGCKFCDTPQADPKEYDVSELEKEILKFKGFHSVSLTGGEPLLQSDFLKEFLPKIKSSVPGVYLETNGTLPGALKDVIDFVDIIAMDIKLPSATGQNAFWAEHEEFLKISKPKDVFVKMVITAGTEQSDIVSAGRIITNTNSDIFVVLQPNWQEVDSALLSKMVAFKKYFFETGVRNIKIMPQAHKYAGIK